MRQFPKVLALFLVVAFCRGNALTLAKEPPTFERDWLPVVAEMERYHGLSDKVRNLKKQIDAEADANVKDDLQKQGYELILAFNESKKRVLALTDSALQVVDPRIDDSVVCKLRFLQCGENYLSGEYFKAADQGAFIAFNYPKSDFAHAAAVIALGSYGKIYRTDKDTNHEGTKVKFIALINHMIAMWPDHPGTAAARDILPVLK